MTDRSARSTARLHWAWVVAGVSFVALLGAAAFLATLYFVFEQWAGFPLTEATIRWGALRIVPCFALGCALYLVYRKAPLKAPWICSAISCSSIARDCALLR